MPRHDESRATHIDRVTSDLRRAIMSHEFEPGQRLSAEALATRFDVSPTPLREAFARLAGEGLVTYRSQRGVRVAPLLTSEMEEIYEIRALLDPLAISRSVSAGAGDDSWRTRLGELHRTMVRLGGTNVLAIPEAEYDSYEEAHVAFHRATLERCGSTWLIRITDSLLDHSRRFRHVSIPLRTRFGSIAAEHAEILDACLSGDPDRAARAQLHHLENTRDAIRSLVPRSSDTLGLDDERFSRTEK